MNPVFIIVGVIVLFIIIGVYSYFEDKKRTAAMEEAANALGLTFYKEGKGIAPSLGGLDIMKKGRHKRYRNLIVAETADVKVAIVDYRFVVGSGKSKKTYAQALIVLESNHFRAPDFYARPEGMFDSIGGALGFQDIDFDEHPQFSKAFVLKSGTEALTRQFFDFELLDFFAGKKKLTFESRGNQFVYYRTRKRMKPEELTDYIKEAYTFFGALRDRNSRDGVQDLAS